MNTQEYIESGILEQYALGELQEAERTEVEQLANQYPVIRQELDIVVEALAGYAACHTQTPPAGMRERVLAGWKAALDTNTDSAMPAASTPVVRSITSAPAPKIAAPTGRVNWLMAASILLLLGSLAANWLFYSKWQTAESVLASVQSEQTLLAATHQAVEKRASEQTQEIAILRNDEFRSITLAGTPAAPKAKARVLYNPATRAVYVDVRNLPAPPVGKQYQLWALDNGQPIDAGVLAAATAAGDNLQQMKNIARAQAFAMTVERIGGSPTPTLSTMTVVGNI